MQRFEKRTEILNDLLKINRDCTETCQKIIPEVTDKPMAYRLLEKMVSVCRDCIAELHMRVDPTYGDPADAVDLKGGIYRAWQHSSNQVLFPQRAPEILIRCEQEIKSIKRAYEQALQREYEFTEDTRELLRCHLKRLRDTTEFIGECKRRNISYATTLC